MSELSYIDKKVISEVVDFITIENKEVKKFMTTFSKKGSWGLWWDAKGLRNSSDKGDVLNKMKSYNLLHEKILACLQAVERNDKNSYELIVALYKEIEELIRDADIHADGESKALCILAKEFLDNKWKLDHNVKRVQCVVLTNELKRTKDFADTLNQRLEKVIDTFVSLQEDNQKLHEGNQNLQKSIHDLNEKNLELEDTMRKVRHENQGLKDMISDMQERADQRLREVVEENRRSMQKMLIEMREIKIESK